MLPSFETTRFRILREIGHGGMGVVYAALDQERNLEVALKTISQLNPDSAHAFKQEFRSVADIVHPNLICLHELFAEGDQWFFTMELIHGEHFLQFVRAKEVHVSDTPQPTALPPAETPVTSAGYTSGMTLLRVAGREQLAAVRSLAQPEVFVPPAQPMVRRPLECDLDRLRDILRQVAQGLVAVHERGKLHRDIKSRNVMVTPQGRAVILDFGLASAIEDLKRTGPRGVVGTLAYASPEQAVGESLTPASDWYSLGVMIFEALTGARPLAGGDSESLIRRKLTVPAPAPEELAEGVPEDLNELCRALLRIDPAQRPTGAEILDILNVGPKATYFAGTTPSAVDFIGRRKELAALESALSMAREGSAAVALVHGPSGFGKSSLIQKFLDGASSTDTLVLRGRCYEQESVPYKGIDSAIDTLAEQIDDWEDVIAPIDLSLLGALVHVFPVLLRSEIIRRRSEKRPEVVDPQMRRRAAFQCLREILSGIGRHRQVIFCIDDMQWSDAESVQLLSSLLAPPNPPAVLYISSYRSEYEDRNPWLQQWLEVVKGSGTHSFSIPIGGFSPEESEELVRRILGSQRASNGLSPTKIVAEGEGNPFFISQLAQSVRERGSKTEMLADGTTLDSLLRNRVATLPPSARELLEIIAVAGQPIAKSDAYAAAALEQQDPVNFNILRIANLTRTFNFGDVEMVETYHDRIRESVSQSLPPDLARFRHAALAAQLETVAGMDPETLAVHFDGAGDAGKASHYYELAANRAASALAFDKAARYYEKTLALGAFSEAERHRILGKQAEALTNSGHAYAAAKIYDSLSHQAEAAESTEMDRRAGFLYCSTGHLDEGLRVYDRVVSQLGLSDPRGRRMLVAHIVGRLLALKVRGLKYTLRTADQVPQELLTRIDTSWSLSAGLAIIDISRAMNFGLICLSAALRAGEPERLMDAIMMSAWIPIMTGIGGQKMANRLLAISEDLAARIGTPKAQAVVEHSKAAASHGSAEWHNTLAHIERAQRLYRSHCNGISWQMAVTTTLLLYTKYAVGDYVEMGRYAEASIKEAQETGDTYSTTIAETFPMPIWYLAQDKVAEARECVEKGLARWSTRGYDVQNAMAVMASGLIDFYAGEPVRFLSYIEKEWRLMCEYGFAQHPAMRGPFLSLWTRALLAKASRPDISPAERRQLWKMAEQKTKWLKKSPGHFSQATYPSAMAQLAEVRGDIQTARLKYGESERHFDQLGMNGYAASLQRKRGQLTEGAEGERIVREAEERLRRCGAVNPGRLAATLVGGWEEVP